MAADKKEAASKQEALENALKKIEKDFGKGSIMRLGDAKAHMDIEVIPTGILPLDIALGVGGIPRGRIIEVYGPESSGKTTVTLHMIAEAQKNGGIAAFIDAEHALDPVYAKALGVDIDSLLIDLYDTYQPLCARSGHPLKLDLPESPLPTIASDAAALRQILAIFLDNAQSHTPAGTHICIDTKCTANALLLRISDDGPGVSSEDAPHLFERFYRADHAHSSKKHSGLGLSIAQALANALGASVAYEPTPQGGKVNDREAGREGPLGGARFILQIPR